MPIIVMFASPGAPRPEKRIFVDGRSPGSRVLTSCCLPGFAQWLVCSGSPITVAGAAAALILWRIAPHSLFACSVAGQDRLECQ